MEFGKTSLRLVMGLIIYNKTGPGRLSPFLKWLGWTFWEEFDLNRYNFQKLGVAPSSMRIFFILDPSLFRTKWPFSILGNWSGPKNKLDYLETSSDIFMLCLLVTHKLLCDYKLIMIKNMQHYNIILFVLLLLVVSYSVV